MLHHRAGRRVEEFDDVERVGDVFEVGLRKSALAVLEDLHIADDRDSVRRFVVARRLMRIGAVPEVVHLDVAAAADDKFRREIPDMLRQIGITGQFFCHFPHRIA